MKRRTIVGLAGLCALGLSAGSAGAAAPVLRKQVSQKGDFVLLGNTLGYSCDLAVPPVVGTVSNMCGSLTSDTSPDLFWRADAPGPGQASADLAILPSEARSTAVLKVPAGAAITHAYLYWGARAAAAGADADITIDRPGAGGFSATATALASSIETQGNPPNQLHFYQSVADVTALVQANGEGAYRISGVDMDEVRNVDNNWSFGGWWMVVFYALPSDPARNLALFDGLKLVGINQPQQIALSGFLVPNAGFGAKLGVIGWEGDTGVGVGDQLTFNGGLPLSDAVNPANNFFNSSRSYLGAPVSNAGDLPQLTGGNGSLAGLDIDVVDISTKVKPGDTSATIDASSGGEFIFLGGFVTSISTIKPDYTTSTKAAVDLNGGALVPGDVIEYTINAINSGNDTAINVVLTDPLPAGVTYVPGSLEIQTGPNAGVKTDVAGDDQADYNAGTKTITARLGAGANGSMGGTMPEGTSSQLRFRVTVNAGASGSIANQGLIGFAGQQGSPPETSPTDDGAQGGLTDPTVVTIAGCTSNADCGGAKPVCDLAVAPGTCVQCLVDADCKAPATCNAATKTCSCSPSGAEVCDGVDNDCDGLVDEGFNVGAPCSAGVGACLKMGTLACNGMGGASCSAVAGMPGLEICGDLIDNDCDGVPDDSCGLDTDKDGIPDAVEVMLGTNPNDADSDDDGTFDGQEPQLDQDTDGDGKINALDPDSDNDGLNDGTELGKGCGHPDTNVAAGNCTADADGGGTKTNPLDPDTDDGGVSDGEEDANKNGVVDGGETDPTTGHGNDDDGDGDGLTNDEEEQLGTDPNDADSDDDGVIDGQEPEPDQDTDGDGKINALDPDSDNDGLKDGTEVGKGCGHPATDAAAGNCVADADNGTTTTNPLDPDTDDGGTKDGDEDTNKNGVVDAGETDPTTGHGADDMVMNPDSDDDGVPDDVEVENGTNPNDADSDDDGVIDGDEPSPTTDTDGDGQINALDPDSDNDGLKDGTELGKGCNGPGTDATKGSCVPDGDNGATTTNPLDPDTDDGGTKDGDEDTNKNGVVDGGETDPTTGHGADDMVKNPDSDNDGVPDDVELLNGTNPTDGDSDDDGVSDGQEKSPTEDTDGDGLINALDPDSDDDGLKDGTELGLDCDGPGTDATKGDCVPDGDSGATTTSPLDPDTDGGGVKDGVEDANKNGVVDAGERDPSTKGDDAKDAPEDEVVLSGDGIFSCATQGGANDAGQPLVLGAALAALVGLRRRRRSA